MDKKTVIAILLIFLVIMGYQLVVLPLVSPPPEAPEPRAPVTAVQEEVPPPPPAIPPAEAPAEEPPPLPVPPADTAREDIVFEEPLFRTVVDSQWGGLRSWKLREYTYGKNAGDVSGTPVELVSPGAAPGPLGLSFVDAFSKRAFVAPFSAEAGEGELSLWAVDQYGLMVKRHYRFHPDNYQVEMEISFENRGEAPRNVSWEIPWGPGLDRFRPEGGTNRAEVAALVGEKVDKVKVKNPGEVRGFGRVSWIGIRDRYFLAALAPREGTLSAFAKKTADARLEIGLRSDPFTIAPRQVVSFRITAYIGPKERELLAAHGIGLERAVDYGWFSWLALPFLSVLKFFYRYLHNWGLAIMALTLLVKLALFPITQGMYRSMRKMQSLQPQIQALKKKFKDDSQTLQRETMALYKQYKVNPMAGCLPMVIQIPVFLALYRVLYSAIELRGASFLYIPDLSEKDPYYITPILMGATMLIQQRMSPTTGDPKQAKMMMFMPIIFTAMFLNFSSGLVLYFLCSNLLAIGEQQIIRKWSSSPAPQPESVPATPPKKGGKKKKKS